MEYRQTMSPEYQTGRNYKYGKLIDSYNFSEEFPRARGKIPLARF